MEFLFNYQLFPFHVHHRYSWANYVLRFGPFRTMFILFILYWFCLYNLKQYVTYCMSLPFKVSKLRSKDYKRKFKYEEW